MRALAASAVAAFAGVAFAAPVADAATPPTVTATVAARSVGLGDPFRYTVEARTTSAGALRVVADTGPFAVVAPPTTSRSRSGGVAVVRVVQTLACLDRGCAPGAQPRRVVLPPARASSGGGWVASRAQTIVLVPRVPQSAVAASRARYRRQVDLPEASTPIAPGLASALLWAAAALAATCALVLLLSGRRRGAAGAGVTLVGRLEHALRLLRESAARPAADRRRAADYVARAVGAAEIADAASRVAWGPPDPGPADVDALAERVETTLGGER